MPPLRIVLLAVLLLGLAAATLLPGRHAADGAAPGYAAGAPSPYGSSAALRNLLF